MTAVAFDCVSLRRGARRVLAEVSATIAPGRVTALIGPNGAGKSSLLMVAAGLLRPTAGTVAHDGRPLAAIDRRTLARTRAYLPQNPHLDWPISVERVVALGLTPHLSGFGRWPGHARARLDAALARHGLLPLRARAATELSGGELARVMLARATVGGPALLIADEPTAGLDPRHAIEAGGQLRALADAGCTVLVALHDLSLAWRIADEVLALADGAVVAHGPAAAVIAPAVLERLFDAPARVGEDGAVVFGA